MFGQNSNSQALKEDPNQMINPPQGFDAPIFTWNPHCISHKLTLDDEHLVCTSKEGSGFKTVTGTEVFIEGGKYYFEIFVNKGQLLKVGVCRPGPNNLEEAFCDTKKGWGIYNGETRHNSNSSGPKYGTQLQSGDILGVAVDMADGTIQFLRNGSSWGIAFKDPQLAKGELVAAVAPIYVKDVFTLRSMIKQD